MTDITKALEIARKHAKLKPQSYYAEPFHPHEWVLDAINEALSKQPVIPDAALMNVITEWEFDNGYDFVDSEVSDLVNRINHALKGESK